MNLEDFLSEWYGDSPYVHVQTSGSTGAPKPMLAEKRRMLASARITCDFQGLKAGDTALLCMSLDYIAGKMMVVRSLERGLRLIAVEPSGHPLSLSQRYQSPLLQEVSQRYQSPLLQGLSQRYQSPLLQEGVGEVILAAMPLGDVTFAAMVPMQVWNTLQVPEERERLRQIRHLIIGGGAIDEALADDLKAFPHAVWSTYGMTETLSHIALRRLNGPDASDWYTPFPSVKVSLTGDNCLVIDAHEVCPHTLTTNDIAELDGRRFRILGRKDNVICSGGIKIQAEEVERQLRPHLQVPYLLSKRADPKFGEVAVLLTEGSVDEARAVCERVLPKYYQPRAYIHVDHIPLTATGKPARRQAEALLK
jgi:O-succinylbenzoic acid--CoA ligase